MRPVWPGGAAAGPDWRGEGALAAARAAFVKRRIGASALTFAIRKVPTVRQQAAIVAIRNSRRRRTRRSNSFGTNVLAASLFLGFVVYNSAPLLQRTLTGSTDMLDRESAVERSAYYRNCNAARAAGVAPISRGSPGYRSELDGDGDSVACEPIRL